MPGATTSYALQELRGRYKVTEVDLTELDELSFKKPTVVRVHARVWPRDKRLAA